MNIYTDSTKIRIKTVEKIKENIIAGERIVEDVVNVVKPNIQLQPTLVLVYLMLYVITFDMVL